jgi:hypothetical protein
VRVLFLTMFMPGLRRTGAEVATHGFVGALREAGHDVTLLGYRRAGTDPPLDAGDHVVADRHIETEAAGIHALGWMARAVATRLPYTQAKYVSRGYRAAVSRELDAAPDAIVLDHARMGWLVPRGGWPAPFALVAHNVEHELYAELARQGGARHLADAREARLIRRAEETLVPRAAEVWTLTESDAEKLGALGARRTRSFAIPSTGSAQPPGAATHDVSVLGGWHWKSNAAGLRWFVDDVVPHLEGLDVRVGGASAEPIAGDRPGVRVVGPVPDALAFLQSGRAIAVPSVAGAGVQVKTLDAIAAGRPLVATPTAMRGIDDPPPTVHVAEDGRSFADALRAAVAQGAAGGAAEAQEWANTRRERFVHTLDAAIRAVAETAR